MNKYLNRVTCADCLDVLRDLPDKCVDLVLTDPPYNAGREFDNDNLSENDFCDFTRQWMSECKRVMKSVSNIVVIIGVKYQKPITLNLFDLFNYSWEFVWWKSNGMLNGKATFAVWDKVLWFNKGEGFHKRNPCVPRDVWNLPIIPQKNNFGHPTPKDLKGIRNIVELLSNESDIILDPFLGSGTTAIACIKTNRQWIGIEKEQKYCDIANKRIQDELDQFKMF